MCQCQPDRQLGGVKHLAGTPANSTFAGFPAYTLFHYVISLNDGGSGTIHPVLSPTLNPVSLTTQINYTY